MFIAERESNAPHDKNDGCRERMLSIHISVGCCRCYKQVNYTNQMHRLYLPTKFFCAAMLIIVTVRCAADMHVSMADMVAGCKPSLQSSSAVDDCFFSFSCTRCSSSGRTVMLMHW